jgi:actin interacting protein 3
MANEGSVDIAPRGSIASSRSSISRRNPQQQLSQIEKSVTHLLVATKQLLETLTQWSRGTATEGDVSDVYVRLGYEFNIACRSFNAIGVETHDLGPVPDLLRTILEDTLSQEASQASLDRFLPRIRDIIINLLQGLKRKQSRLRSRSSKDGSAQSDDGSLSQIPSRASISRPGPGSREGSLSELTPRELPPRVSSRGDERSMSPKVPEISTSRSERYDSHLNTGSESSLSSTTAQGIPVTAPPYPAIETMPPEPEPQPQPPPHATTFSNSSNTPPAKDALLALQRGGDLERRASRRFSTYQISKQLGGAASGIMIPPAQNGPIPNRGREVRESLNAVRQRGSQIYNRQKSERRLIGEESPHRQMPSRISEESLRSQGKSKELETYSELEGSEGPVATATINGPLEGPVVTPTTPASAGTTPSRQIARKQPESSPPTSQQFVPEESPQPGKPLTLFLQFKSKVKKIVLDDGSNDLSIPNLQLQFIEKFQWNTHNDGIDLPEIYIQDSVSGVRYELEDLNDIKNNSVLVLNFEPLDEVKRHIDDGMSGLRRVVEGIKTTVDNQQSTILRISDRQQETQKEIASIATAPMAPMRQTSLSSNSGIVYSKFGGDQLVEIQTIRRNLAILRQTYSSLVSDVEASMAEVKTKSTAVKSAAINAALPSLSGDSGRAYIESSLHGSLQKEQSAILERVEDVQDSIEDLRKDVVTRGVRPLPRQLEQVAKDMSNATADLKKLEAFVAKETPLWNKIWKQELQDVCDDREVLREVEALIGDMRHDLEQSEQTFRLVEEACKQQNAMAANGPVVAGVTRTASGGARVPGLAFREGGNPEEAKHGVLVEVKGLTIDHESRLEAIERAERARQKELESRKEGAFKKELGNFVEEGKLKKSGGVEEAERIRKAKDDRIRREVWERQNERNKTAAEGPPPLATTDSS